MDFTSTTILFLALLVLAVLLYYLGQTLFRNISGRRHSAKLNQIKYEIFQTAMDQRSTFSVEFTAEDMQGRKISGPCFKYTDKTLFIDAGGTFASEQWSRQPVHIFFNITSKNKASFYQFNSMILEARRAAGTFLLKLPMPPYLDPGQKRSFVRVEPQAGAVMGLGIWPLPAGHPMPTTITGMAQAILNYRPGKVEDVQVVNISAGGLRLTMKKNLQPLKDIDLSKGSQVLCLLILKHNDTGAPLPFWLACTVAAGGDDMEHPGSLFLGLRYTHWALMEAGQNNNIVWFPIHTGRGAAPLAAWVMRHHLEQYKNL